MSKTKKSGTKSNNSKGMGKKNSPSEDTTTKFDVAKAWNKLQRSYDEIMADSNKSSGSSSDEDWDEATMEITTEYIVTARSKSGLSSTASASNINNNNSAYRSSSDWVPVAQVCIVRPIHLEENEAQSGHGGSAIVSPTQAAISYYCREISYAATLAAPILKSLPRNAIEYGYEPIDSFMKFVYSDVISGKTESFVNGDNEKVSMTKSKARQILQLDDGCNDASLIKRSYKKLSMAYHPDRFINSDKTKEEVDESTHQFTLVKMAYEALNSGVRNNNGGGDEGEATNGDDSSSSLRRSSWYESLGGKSRTEFVGPIELLSVDTASLLCNKAFKCGVIGLDSDITMAFVVRNQALAR